MTADLVVQHCSPTLAGIKKGTLFSCGCASRKEIFDGIRSLNQKLVLKGLRVLSLRCLGGQALIYVFRPAFLAADLSGGEVRQLLRGAGYRSEHVEHLILILIRKLKEGEAFPHEIGLFLVTHRRMCRALLRIRPKDASAAAAERSMGT